MRRTIYTILVAVALVLSGCGDKGKGGSGGSGFDDGNGGVPPVTDPPVTVDPGTGAEVLLTLSSKAAFDDYLGWTSNVPTNIKVNIDLQKFGTYSKTGGGFDYGFGGYIQIKFTDSGSTYTDIFSSLVPGGGVVTSNTQNHKYNLVSSDYPELSGAIGYHGFFEDVRGRSNASVPVFGGAVILVIDSTNDLGDGQGPTSANGSVWFKNYIGYAPVSPTSCWFVSVGPYDCRSWKHNGGVQTKASIYPTNGYTKLGDFTGLDMKKAFNSQL